MKFVHEKCSIECEAANIVSRKILRNSFIEIKAVGKCTTYKCKLNSEASITKEIQNPKEHKYKKTSQLNAGDKFECEELFLAVNTHKALKIEIVNYTGRHKAQVTNTDHYTFAEISRQFPNIPVREISSPLALDNPAA